MKTIPRCYDSHVHFFGTGEMQAAGILSSLTATAALPAVLTKNNLRRGDWLYAYGWNESAWSEKPSLNFLDQHFPQTPVFLLRADAHAAWINTRGAEIAGLELSPEEQASGVLRGTSLQKVRSLLPAYTREQQRDFADRAQRIFRTAGFTHVRDMSGEALPWDILCEMEDQGSLNLYLEENFFIETEAQFDHVLRDALRARQDERSRLRVQGMKIFYDGALGSEGALLSQCYCHTNRKGYQYHSDEMVQALMRKCSENDLDLAVHTIGDEASHRVLQLADQVQSRGHKFQLHLEHVELLRDESLDLMKSVRPICHMQPCHWLADKKWLFDKIGDLKPYAFRWAELEARGVPLQWGSDSPVEAPSVKRNILALADAVVSGIPNLSGDASRHHSHPNPAWGGECSSEFDLEWNFLRFLDSRS